MPAAQRQPRRPPRRVALAALLGLAGIVAAVVIAAAGDLPPPRQVQFGGTAAVLPTVTAAAERTDPDGIVFDLNTVRTYDITLSAAALATLNNDPVAEQYVQGSVTVDGVTYGPIGVRYKGFFGVLRSCFFTGENTCAKLSYKLKFNHYDPDQRYHGLKRLNFHPMKDDQAQMREILSYQTFRQAGVAAPRSVYAWLTLNGEALGLFILTENIDDRFTSDRFADTGLGILHKEIWPLDLDASLSLAVDRQTDATGGGATDRSGLRAFEAALQAVDGDPPAVAAVLDEYFEDPETLFAYLAADRLVDNWDGIVAWYCTPDCSNHNFFLYEHPNSDRFTLIPWDVEHSWRGFSPIRDYFDMPDWDELERGCDPVTVFWDIEGRPPYCDSILHALVTEGWERYIEASRLLITETAPLEGFIWQIQELSKLIAPYVEEDPNGPGLAEWRQAVAALYREAEARYGYIEKKIAAWDADGKIPSDGK